MSTVGPALPGVTEMEVDGSLSVYSHSTQQVLLLNETAGQVWRLVDGRRTADQIVDELAQTYAVDASRIRDQVTGTIQSFADGGLIDPVT